MARYQSDLNDINFNLFDLLEVQKYAEGYEANDLKEIISQFDKFVENEIWPAREEGDQVGAKLKDGVVTTPPSFKKANQSYYENGWYGLSYPEDIGGMPAPEAIRAACESLGIGANVSWSMYYGLTRGAMNLLLALGSKEQKDLYVPKMMSGEWGGTMCLTEAGAGSDVGAVTSTAEPLGKDRYKIRGVKIFISSGENDLYQNIVHLVLARVPGAPAGTKGLSLFIVPKFKVNADGSIGERNDMKCTKIEEKMGLHGSATCELTFGESGSCEGWIVGKEGEGMANMFHMMNEARLLCGIQGEGQANLATMLAIQYAKERSQFGLDIVNLPDVKRMLLKMRAMSRGMRALNLYVASLFDREKKGEGVEPEIALLTPISKAWCSDEGFNVSVEAIQVHGGYGYCCEYGIEQFARDTKIATIYEGTNGIQAIDFITRKILKDEGKTFMAMGDKIMNSLKNPVASSWKDEHSLMLKNLGRAGEVMNKFATYAAQKKMDALLSHATDFLSYCGNLIIAWRLLESALKAHELMKGANGPMLEFYQSKVTDYKIFCQHVLVKNAGLSQTILNFDDELSRLAV